LVDGNDIRPTALLHAIVGSLETCVVSAMAHCSLRAGRDQVLTLPREDALADFSNHRVLWMGAWLAVRMRIGMGLTAKAKLWGLERRRAEGVDYISKISSWPGSSRPRAPIAPPAASRATTEPWPRITWSGSAAAVRGHSWLSARPSSQSWPVPSAVQKCNTISKIPVPLVTFYSQLYSSKRPTLALALQTQSPNAGHELRRISPGFLLGVRSTTEKLTCNRTCSLTH
jgi:hypothetical protein